MAHDLAGQCTSDCRRIGCPDDDAEEELPEENKTEQLNIDLFNPTKADIIALVAECKGLEISGINDTAGYEKVKEAKNKLVHARGKIEKAGKAFRAKALAYQKAVIKLEDELVALIEPTEKELKAKLSRNLLTTKRLNWNVLRSCRPGSLI
jgi:hypothetical protein